VSVSFDSNSYALKAARQALPTATVPKKPFKSKATTSDQMDSDKIPQKEKAAFLHFGVLRKNIKLWDETQFTGTPNRRAPSLPSYALYGGRIRFFRTILTP